MFLSRKTDPLWDSYAADCYTPVKKNSLLMQARTTLTDTVGSKSNQTQQCTHYMIPAEAQEQGKLYPWC